MPLTLLTFHGGLILPSKDGESKECANVYMRVEGFSSIVSTRSATRRKLALARTAHPSRCVSEREYERASERIMCGAERRVDAVAAVPGDARAARRDEEAVQHT